MPRWRGEPSESFHTEEPFGSGRLRKRPAIRFQRARGEAEDDNAQAPQLPPTDAAALYRDVIGADGQAARGAGAGPGENCPVCGVRLRLGQAPQDATIRAHLRSTAHLAALQHTEPTLAPLHLPRNSIGWRILEAQGWAQEHGLGPRGRQGDRLPIRAKAPKVDTLGIGVAVAPEPEPAAAAPRAQNLRDVRREHAHDRRERDRLRRHMYS